VGNEVIVNPVFWLIVLLSVGVSRVGKKSEQGSLDVMLLFIWYKCTPTSEGLYTIILRYTENDENVHQKQLGRTHESTQNS
jgi:hypothetical protein